MSDPQRDISPERKAAFYAGTGMIVVGFLSFFSVFVTGAMNFGNFDHFEDQARSSMLRAIVGMALMIAGGIVSNIGKGGLAGSGVKLDPRQARRDLEPFSRQTGGMIADAVDEFRGEAKPDAQPMVKIRCRACGQLNSEQAKFCDQCGQPL